MSPIDKALMGVFIAIAIVFVVGNAIFIFNAYKRKKILKG